MPWVYVCSDTMIDFNVEMAKKNRSFHKIPNIETKQCAYYENVDETSQNGHVFSMCANVASANKPPVSLEHNSWFHVDGCYSVNKSSHKLGAKIVERVCCLSGKVNKITNRTKCIIMRSCSTKLTVATSVLAPSFLTGDRSYVRI